MRRIAYILSAYTDAPHLARLVAALDDGGADFYIHVDRKVDSRPFHRLLDGKATFVPSHWISWGGWQQVEYQKELLAAVLHSGRDYMRVVCLSGQDYPLWSNMRIRRYFDEHPDAEFIMGLNLTRCTDRAQRSKICCYHFFRDLPWRSLWWKNKLIVASRASVLIRLSMAARPTSTSDPTIGLSPCPVPDTSMKGSAPNGNWYATSTPVLCPANSAFRHLYSTRPSPVMLSYTRVIIPAFQD